MPHLITDIPAITLTASHDLHHHVSPRHDPVCRSMNSPILHDDVFDVESNDNVSRDLQGLALAPQSHGWRTWSWGEKRYLVADKPGAVAMFDFTIPEPESQVEQEAASEDEAAEVLEAESEAEGLALAERDAPTRPRPETDSASVLIAYQRSAQFRLGSVLCWVDGDRDSGQVINGYWKEKERNMGVVAVVAEHLEVGRHRLSCELLDRTADPNGGREFRLIAVMHG